jgi:hypothetical protein
MNLTLNMATRGRAHLLAETIERTLANVTLATTTMLVNVDEDDGPSREAAMKFFPEIAVSVEPREESLGAKYNRALRNAPADIYLTMVDYAPILTKGFDYRVQEAAAIYPDKILCCYGHWANLSFPSLQAVTHTLAGKMGFIYPPFFPFWFVDHWLQDVVDMIGREVFVDVEVDCHSRRPDKTTRLRDVAFWSVLYDALYPLRRECAFSIIQGDDFEETPARKRALMQNWTRVNEYAKILHRGLRADVAGIHDARGTDAPDPGYDAIKAKAKIMLRNAVKLIEAEQAAA